MWARPAVNASKAKESKPCQPAIFEQLGVQSPDWRPRNNKDLDISVSILSLTESWSPSEVHSLFPEYQSPVTLSTLLSLW